jgi:hypothetical protein
MVTIYVFAATNLLKISHSELLSCPAPEGCDSVCYVTTIKREVFYPLCFQNTWIDADS